MKLTTKQKTRARASKKAEQTLERYMKLAKKNIQYNLNPRPILELVDFQLRSYIVKGTIVDKKTIAILWSKHYRLRQDIAIYEESQRNKGGKYDTYEDMFNRELDLIDIH